MLTHFEGSYIGVGTERTGAKVAVCALVHDLAIVVAGVVGTIHIDAGRTSPVLGTVVAVRLGSTGILCLSLRASDEANDQKCDFCRVFHGLILCSKGFELRLG